MRDCPKCFKPFGAQYIPSCVCDIPPRCRHCHHGKDGHSSRDGTCEHKHEWTGHIPLTLTVGAVGAAP
jgi:hypothetical protein